MDRSDKEIKRGQQAAENQTLPEMIGRLGEDIGTLIDAKISLLKVEIKEEVSAYTSSLIGMAIGAVIAIVGFALFNVAIAFLISSLFQDADLSEPVKYALGFIITAAAYLIAGAVITLKMKNRLARRDLVPSRSVKEIEKDRRWIEREL
jgi:uncharacterized membrane protein YqjE